MTAIWPPLADIMRAAGMITDDTAHLDSPPREVCCTCGHVAEYRDDVCRDATGVWHAPSCGGHYVEEEP